MKNKKGFTLVELLAVIALLGIIAIIVVPNVLKSVEKARKDAFIDEAKVIYSEATNKFLKEKINGNKISNINNETNTLDIEDNGIKYTIRLDSEGNVTAFKASNKKFCITGVGKFIEDVDASDVLPMNEENELNCSGDTLMKGEKITLKLVQKNADRPFTQNVDPTEIYFKYQEGWFDREDSKGTLIADISTLPAKKNHYFNGFVLNDSYKKVIDYNGAILVDLQGLLDGDIVFNNVNQTTTKVYADMEKKYYIVKFNPNGGRGNMRDITCFYGDNYKLSDLGYSRTGYTFSKWSSSFGNTYNNGQSLPYIDDDNENEISKYKYNIGNNTPAVDNLVAQWTANKYTVTLNSNGGNIGNPTKIVTFDSEIGDLPTPNKDGYVFKGWFTDSVGGTQITSATIYITPNNVMYYARYDECTGGSYCVNNVSKLCAAGSYQSNNGASNCVACPTGKTSTAGSTVCNSCSNAAHVVNWVAPSWTNSNTVNNDCKIYSCATGYTNKSNSCVANTYVVTFDGNGGSVGTTSVTCTYDKDCAFNNNGVVRNGYEFLGWSTSSTGTVQYTSGGKNLVNTQNGTIKLYAVWKAINYNIEYDLGTNGKWPSGAVYPSVGAIDEVIQISKPNRSSCYSFSGWKITNKSDAALQGNSQTNVTKSIGTKTTSSYTYFKNLGTAGSTVQLSASWSYTCDDDDYTPPKTSTGTSSKSSSGSSSCDAACEIKYISDNWPTRADGTGMSQKEATEYWKENPITTPAGNKVDDYSDVENTRTKGDLEYNKEGSCTVNVTCK